MAGSTARPAKAPDTKVEELSLQMLHAQIESEEVIERYVKNQLSPEERQSFEEHFFACDECFEKLQATERFVAGLREAAELGQLSSGNRAATAGVTAGWLRWAFAACACTAVAFAALAAWMFFGKIPALTGELKATSAQLQVQRQKLAHLEQRAGARELAEANVPLVILQESRGQEAPVASLPPEARQLVVWVEIGSTRFRSYRMDVYSQSNRLVVSVDNLKPGPYGALAISIPASILPPGDIRVTLMGQNPPPASLVGEYRLQIRKP